MKTVFPYRYILALPILNMAIYQGVDEAEARGTDEQPFSVKPLLIRYGETYSAWKQ